MSITLDKALERINGHSTAPYFVNVNNCQDYCALREGLLIFKTVRLSSIEYSPPHLPLPDTQKLLADLKNSTEPVIVIGLLEFLAFRDRMELKQAISEISSLTKKIVVLCSGLESYFMETIIPNDIRLKDRVILINGEATGVPLLTLSTFNIAKDKTFGSMRDFLKFVEDTGNLSATVITKLGKKAFESGLWSIRAVTSAYDALCAIDSNLASEFSKDCGTERDWAYLYNELEGGNKSYSDICLRIFGNTDAAGTLKKYREYAAQERWLLWFLLKVSPAKNYAAYAAKKTKTCTQLIHFIYCSLLDMKHNDNNFIQYYNERKELVKKLPDEYETSAFSALADAKGSEKIHYLTDLTELELKEIIKCIAEYEYSEKELSHILARVYPFLSDYLAEYYFDKSYLDEYFQRYKMQKLKNKIEDDFINLVNERASESPRKFFELPTRSMIFPKDLSDIKVLWVDAMGVEFLSFIVRRCDSLGLKADIKLARAKLPTITDCNKEFFDESRGDKKTRLLDETKHDKAEEYDFSKTELPLYIINELDTINELLEKAKSQITPNRKVLIVSDHGSSRLARIHKGHRIKIDEGSKSQTKVRYCPWKDELKGISTYASDKENGYIVLANYDRFDGGRLSGVELHGGSALEEVVVPMIMLSLKSVTITASLRKSELKLQRRKLESLVISLSDTVKMPLLKVNDKFYKPTQCVKTTYTFELDITKPGKYFASFLDDNQEVVKLIPFQVKSPLGDIDELL